MNAFILFGSGHSTRRASRAFWLPALLALGLLLPGLPAAGAAPVLFTNATVHTVSGATLLHGDVLVQDGVIKGVFDASQPSRQLLPAEVTRVDLSGQHLYPGLIATCTTLGLVEISAVRATRDETEAGEFTPDVQSWIAVNPDSELLPVARANGITHAQPVPLGGLVSGQSGLVALHGWTTRSLAVKSPAALHVFWPAMSLNTTPRGAARERGTWKSLEEQAKERRARLQSLAEFFQEARAYARAREAAGKDGAKPLAPVPAWEAMLPYVRGERPVVVHADEVREIEAALQWAGTNQLRWILAGGRDAWQIAPRLASNGVPVIYTHTFTLPARLEDPYDVQFHAPAVLQAAGVKVILSEGLDADGASNARNLPYSAAQAIAFGLPADEALKSITLYPAQALGVADRLGSMEAGREATFFATDGDLFDIRSRVKRLWFAGQEVPLDSRHTRLYDKYRNRPK